VKENAFVKFGSFFGVFSRVAKHLAKVFYFSTNLIDTLDFAEFRFDVLGFFEIKLTTELL